VELFAKIHLKLFARYTSEEIMKRRFFSNAFTIKVILRCYELVSGLKINFHKLKLAEC